MLCQKQSKDSQNTRNDHWCTNRHMSTKTVPTVYQQCTNRQNSQKQSEDSQNSKNDHYVPIVRRPCPRTPNTQSPVPNQLTRRAISRPRCSVHVRCDSGTDDGVISYEQQSEIQGESEMSSSRLDVVVVKCRH